nr:uncharacterized protein LOC126532055 [Dermacentor andersoni]
MYSYVQKFVRSCPDCERRKSSPCLSPAGLQPLSCPRRPFGHVGTDFYGPLPLTSAGNRGAIVAVDHLTRYAETSALPVATACDVASLLLRQFIPSHDPPQELLSDHGRVLLSELIEATLKECDVVHRTTTAYHPQTNGLTERFNSTLGNMLAMHVASDHTNGMPFCLSQPTPTIPPLRAPLAFHHFSYCTAGTRSPQSTQSFRTSRMQLSTRLFLLQARHAEECRDLARAFASNDQERQQSFRGDTTSALTFIPGALVGLSVASTAPELPSKLLPKYGGPYRVIERTFPVNYVIQPVERSSDMRCRGRDLVNADHLKTYYNPPIATSC